MSFQIITDSGSDLNAAMAEQLDVLVAPLSVELDGSVFTEGAITPKQLYDHLKNGKMPKTAAVNPDGWSDYIRPSLNAGRDVLVMTFSSGLSATCQSALIAAEELREEFPERKLIVIDTLCAALGQGMLVWHAARLRDEGKTIDETAAWAEEYKHRLCHWFTVEDLMHLKRGGRISAATAVVGTMLNIKPVLRMDDNGHLENVSKARGRKAALNSLLDRMGEGMSPQGNDTVFIGHGDCLADAEYMAQQMKERFGVKEVIIDYVGAVIGAHTGPGVLAIFFFGPHR